VWSTSTTSVVVTTTRNTTARPTTVGELVELASLPAVLTVEEAARVLRIGRASAYEAVRRGEIPSVHLGRTIRVPRSGLLLMLGEAAPDDPGAFAAREQDGGTAHG
jgi:excisionase family DNA binding protein